MPYAARMPRSASAARCAPRRRCRSSAVHTLMQHPVSSFPEPARRACRCMLSWSRRTPQPSRCGCCRVQPAC